MKTANFRTVLRRRTIRPMTLLLCSMMPTALKSSDFCGEQSYRCSPMITAITIPPERRREF